MTISTTTHLNFRGDARAALELYREVFGGELTVVSYRDAHAVQDPAEADQVMWGQVVSADGFRVMAYDVPAATAWDRGRNAFYVSVRGSSVEEVTAYWKGLADGATIRQELAPSGWAAAYGMLEDRFGVVWVLDVLTAP
ncbi:VOC family protein [Motilibacter deserti]|uniref:VOC family protein n=1 Tax=Motilibacter deserti TaxID=2714956 RepID=A0ABX0H0E2_9ACTN|nr:VOC family protein [Motilibacter deserti]NHC15290.1 VOC family protein [Motilibacter deserti]